MSYQSFGEIYDVNDKIQAELKATLNGLSDEQATARIAGEKWTIAEILEHIAIVQELVTGFCTELLAKAQEKDTTSNGAALISEDFIAAVESTKNIKYEAPGMLQPTGTKLPGDSLSRLEASNLRLAEMREKFEKANLNRHKISHPVYGDLAAHEWLFLIGNHKLRHLNQIKALMFKLNHSAQKNYREMRESSSLPLS